MFPTTVESATEIPLLPLIVAPALLIMEPPIVLDDTVIPTSLPFIEPALVIPPTKVEPPRPMPILPLIVAPTALTITPPMVL